MNITVATSDGFKMETLQVQGSTTVHVLKGLLAATMNVPASQQQLFLNGQQLGDAQTMQSAGVGNNALLELRTLGAAAAPVPAATQRSVTRLADIPQHVWREPAALLMHIQSNPKLLEELMRINPLMAEAVVNGNSQLLADILRQNAAEKERREREKRQEIMALNADPLNPEHQKKIAERIRMQNVQQNMELAVEQNPESFGSVIMLYVPMEVNGAPLKAFVDSGAQSTIMSVDCAKKCNILHLVDTRFAGVAKGVGSAKIMGRVHQVQLKIGNEFFVSSLTILEQQDMDFLFGLDQLKRHQACIDLKDNCLKIGSQSIPFLPAKDIPKRWEAQANKPSSSSTTPSSSSSSSQASHSSAAAGRQPMPMPMPTAARAPTASSTNSSSANNNTARGTAPVQPAQPAQPARPAVREADMVMLMNLGFPRHKVMEALVATGGNVEMAAAYLFQGGA